MSFYKILGLQPAATADEIKKAYRSLALAYHPDRNPGDKEAESMFKRVQEAYDTLSDLNSRARYDLTLPKIKAKPKTESRKSQYKTKAEREAEAWRLYREEAARGFTVADAPPPKVDLWGEPISNAKKKEPEFVDVFATTYQDGFGQPRLR